MIQPKLSPLVWEVTTIELNQWFSWVGNSLGLKMTADHLLVAEAGGTVIQIAHGL